MIRILIVEDEKAISDLIRLNLMKAGYQCVCVYNGMKAAAIIRWSRRLLLWILN